MCQKKIVLNTQTGEVFKMGCNTWKCPECSKIKQRKLKNYVKTQISNWKHVRMLTLTMRDFGFSNKESYKIIQEGWRRLTTKIRLKVTNFSYIRINEPHESGRIHLHVLISSFLKQQWIARLWKVSLYEAILYVTGQDYYSYTNTFGSVNLKYIGGINAASDYVTKSIVAKYATKNLDAEENNYMIDRPNPRIWSKSNDIQSMREWSPKLNMPHAMIIKPGQIILNSYLIEQLHTDLDQIKQIQQFLVNEWRAENATYS